MRRCLCITAVIVLSCSYICHGLALHPLPNDYFTKRGTIAVRDSNSTACGFLGNSDIYGIGIRVGYYTQTVSVWFANYFVLSEARFLRSINILFLLAVFIGLIWMSHQPSQTYAIEAYVVLTLLIATWHVGVLKNSRFSEKLYKSTAMTSAVRLVTMCGFSGYFFWFWWFGLDRMEETPCGTYVWAVVKTDIYDWVRILNKTIAAFFLFTVFWMHLNDIIDLVRYSYSHHGIGPQFFRDLRRCLLDTDYPFDHDNREGKGDTLSDLEIVAFPPHWSTSRHEDVHLEREINDSYLETAKKIALPPSPKLPPVEYIPEVQDPELLSVSIAKETTIPSMVELLQADQFLEHVLDVKIADHSSHHFIFFKDTRWVSNIYVKTWHSPQYYMKKLTSLYTHRPMRLNILAPLLIHLLHLEKWDHSFLPIMIDIAIRSPYHKTVTPRALHTVLAFHTLEAPPQKRATKVLVTASWSLLMCIAMILSIELALVWNNIYGMGNFGAVGQLIPATLGSGSLVKVLWMWWSRRGELPEEREGYEVEYDLRECAAVYNEVKKRQSEDLIRMDDRGLRRARESA